MKDTCLQVLFPCGWLFGPNLLLTLYRPQKMSLVILWRKLNALYPIHDLFSSAAYWFHTPNDPNYSQFISFLLWFITQSKICTKVCISPLLVWASSHVRHFSVVDIWPKLSHISHQISLCSWPLILFSFFQSFIQRQKTYSFQPCHKRSVGWTSCLISTMIH